MFKKKSSAVAAVGNLLLLFVLFCFQVHAQQDPNPDSPSPVLLGDTDSTRVLAIETRKWNGSLSFAGQKAFPVNQRTTVTIFVQNLDLLADEGANALQIYLNHRNGKTYQFAVEEINKLDNNIYALNVRFYDQLGFRGQPPADGDAVIYLTWRGLASNRLKIGLGRIGGAIQIPTAAKIDAPQTNEPAATDYVGYRWSGDRTRFEEQAAFGPAPDLDNRIRRIGLRVWLNEQFEMPYPTIPYPNPPLMPTTPSSSCSATTNPVCFREHYTMQPLQQWFFKEAFYGSAQVRHRVAWALSQIWVTSGVNVQQSSHMIAYQKILANNAFGNYRSLMLEATLNPAMGDYLDMIRSTKNNPNENYGREILQLFSVGLYMLNQDGTVQSDAQGNPIPTYNQDTINNFAKVFTGWTYCNNGCANSMPGVLNYKDPMILSADNHDTTAKNLMNYPNAVGAQIAACASCTNSAEISAYADESLKKALDNIFYHPNVAPFVSKRLIQQMVTSDPSPAYVGRIAAIFNNNGQNIRGDLKAVVKAILLDPEARGSAKTAPRYGKLREPVQIITNLGRLFPVKSFNGDSPTDGGFSNYLPALNQNPFYAPTVFNYYPPDYVVPGTTLIAPEFGLLNTGTGVKRTNFIYVLTFEGLPQNATDSLRGTSLDYSEYLPIAAGDASGNDLLNLLNEKMMHGVMSAGQRAAILSAVTAVPASDSLLRVKTAVYLIAASSQYQVQR